MRAIWLAAALAACSGDGDDSATDTNSGDGGSSTAFSPRSGVWSADTVDVDTTACTPSSVVVGWQVDLVNAGNAAFDMKDGDDRMTCALDGQDFTCDSRELSQSGESGNSSFALTWVPSGQFAAVDQMSLHIDETRACEGPGCADLEDAGGFTYPCNLAYEVNLVAGG